MNQWSRNLNARSIALVERLDDGGVRRLMLYWILAASLACAIRLSFARGGSVPEWILTSLPYALLVGAPVASLILALHWFRDGENLPQPVTRLAIFGSWTPVSSAAARSMAYYGCTGIMASLLIGMLINIPVRGLEFLAAMPAAGGPAPSWFGPLYKLMLADVVILSSLYAVAFVAALRRVPLFPRLLAAIWVCDLAMQLVIAQTMGGMDGLPGDVAGSLRNLLEGNLKKVLISVALWAPYLLMSKRVNLTFRHRIPAEPVPNS